MEDDLAVELGALESAALTGTAVVLSMRWNELHLAGDGALARRDAAAAHAAFEAALTDLGLTADELLADTETLSSILLYHVVEGEVPAEDVVGLDGQSVPTVNGAEVEITVDGETVMVNDATVTQADVFASNGVIHVIDTVLVPAA